MADQKTAAPAAKAAAPAPKPAAADTPAKKKKGGAVKKWAITVAVSLLVAAICYGAGYFQGTSGKADLEAQAEAATEQARLLEARRRLDLADLALENQNFGIAEAHLRAAAQKLDAVETEGAMATLSGEIAETRIGVTEDIAAQQQKLRGFISRFDQLNPPGSEQTATPAP